MRAALTADELTLLRTADQSTRLYCAVHKPASIFTAQVNGAVSYPLFQIPFDTGSPTSGAIIKDGMTLYIGSSSGARDKGWLRIRGDQTAAASGNLAVAEIGQYARDIDDNDFLTVVEDYRPVSKFPKYDSGWSMDYNVSYTDQNENFGPLARTGPAAIGFLETSVCKLQYVGERSAAYTGGSSISAYAWAFPGTASPATSTSQGTSASPVEIDYSAALASGRYHSLTVTESVTGKTHVRRSLTFVFERSGSNAPFDAEIIAGITGGPEQGGYRTTVRILNTTADQDDFPDGAHIVLFEEARYGDYWYLRNVSGSFQVAETVTGGTSGATGTVSSVTSTLIAIRPSRGFQAGEVITGGTSLATARLRSPCVGGNYPFRQNVVLEGWIVDETVHKDPATGEIEFEVETIDGLMRRARGYPVALTNRTNLSKVTTWENFYNLTIDDAVLHFALWRSTLALVTDVNFHSDLISGSPAGSEVIKYCDMEAGNLFDQLFTWSSRTMFGWVASDTQSSLYVEVDAQIDDTVRAGVPTAFTAASTDRRDRMTVHRSAHADQNAQVTLYGVDYRTPLGSRTPDDPHDYEGDLEEITEGVAAPGQATLSTWASNLRAKRNNDYPRVDIPLTGNWRLDAVPQSYVVMSLAAGDTIRGFTWSSKKLLIRELSIEYNERAGRLMSTVICESETQGIGAASITFPPVSDPPAEVPPAPEEPGAIESDANEVWMGVVDSGFAPHKVVWTGDYFAGGQPTWNSFDWPSVSIVDDFAALVDGSAIYASGDMGAVPTQKIYACTNPTADTPVWTQILAEGDSVLASTIGTGFARSISKLYTYGSRLIVWAKLATGAFAYGEYTGGSWIWTSITQMNTENENVGNRVYTKTNNSFLYNTANTQLATWTNDSGNPTKLWQNLLAGNRYIRRAQTGTKYIHNIDANTDPVSGFNDAGTPVQIHIRGAHRGNQVMFVDDDGGSVGANTGILYTSADGVTWATGATWISGFAEPAALAGGNTLVWVPRLQSNAGEIARISTDGGSSFSNMTGNFWTDHGPAGNFFCANMNLVFRPQT